MKRLLALILAMFMVVGFAVGCGGNDETPGGGGETPSGGETPRGDDNPAPPADPNKEDLKIWAFTDEIPNAILRYQELNPGSIVNDFNIVSHVVSDQDGLYEQALEPALLSGGADAPDLYTAEQAFVLKFSQGGFAEYAATYNDLGIADVAGKIAAAELAQYAVDVGTRDGQVVGLRFQETGSCFIYRRSIANEVFGSDNPDDIRGKVGAGWDNFLAAAEELKNAGYAIVYGPGDVWQVARDGARQPWVVDRRLVIDPARMAFFDLAKTLHDNEYWIGGGAWGDGWFAGMSGTSEPEVFGYMGPAWLINYVMAGNSGDTFGDWAVTGSPVPWTWGGTWLFGHKDLEGAKRDAIAEIIEWITLDTSETGFQYYFANGSLYAGSEMFPAEAETYAKGESAKDAVASAVVMKKSDGTLAFLDGQDMFDEFLPAGAGATSGHWHELDRSINGEFQDRASSYFTGEATFEEAIEGFREWAASTHGLIID